MVAIVMSNPKSVVEYGTAGIVVMLGMTHIDTVPRAARVAKRVVFRPLRKSLRGRRCVSCPLVLRVELGELSRGRTCGRSVACSWLFGSISQPPAYQPGGRLPYGLVVSGHDGPRWRILVCMCSECPLSGTASFGSLQSWSRALGMPERPARVRARG